MNKYIIELNSRDKVWRAEVKLSEEAAYSLEQAGYVITLAEDVYDEETFDMMVEEDL
jgi:hypothetical protein